MLHLSKGPPESRRAESAATPTDYLVLAAITVVLSLATVAQFGGGLIATA